MPALVLSDRMAGITITPKNDLLPTLPLNAAASFSAMAWNQLGRDMPGHTFTWSIDSGGVGTIDSDGTYNAGPVPGTALVRALSDTVSGVFEVTVANNPPTLLTAATADAPTPTDLHLSVAADDDAGEPALTFAWSIQSAPVGALPNFTLNGTNAAKNTTVHLDRAGDYAFLVTISDGSSDITSTVNVTVAPVLTALTVTPAAAVLNLHQSTALTVSASDQFGHALATPPDLQWSKTSGPGDVSAALYTADATAGTAIISAAAGEVNGTTSITINNAAPTVAAPARTPTLHIPGTTAQLTALGDDDGGEANLIYTWSVINAPIDAAPLFSINAGNAAKNTTVTFNRAGAYTFAVAISDSHAAATSQVSLAVTATLTALAVTPSTSNLTTGDTVQLSATAADQFAVAIANPDAITWSIDAGGVGTLGSAGLYSATTAGNATVRAAIGTVSGAASIQVSAPLPPVTLVAQNLVGFSDLVVTGTSNYDTINVQQSGNVFTIISHGITQMITGSFQDLVIHAGPAGSLITVDSSVSINTRLYGGSGSDDLRFNGTGAYNALVSLGGGVDSLTGNGTSTYYWADTADTIHSVAAEVSGGRVHQLSAFYQPWSNDPANANYVPLELAGQTLKDPTDTGTPRRNSLWSLFGSAPRTTDVRQGGIGDCYVLAAIGSLALSGPERIYRVAVDLGDGTYVVRFKRSGIESYVRIDADLANVESAVSPAGGIWIPIIEKAYAFYRSASNTYASLNSGWMFAVLTDLGFSASNIFTFSVDATLSTQILNALAAGQALSIGTGTTIYSAAPLITSHAYVVLGTFYDATAATWMIQIRNVWGYDGTGNDGNPSDGILTMTFAQLRANCSVLVDGF